jgi:hypothetical protein
VYFAVPPNDISVGRFAVVEDPNGSFFSIIRLKGKGIWRVP